MPPVSFQECRVRLMAGCHLVVREEEESYCWVQVKAGNSLEAKEPEEVFLGVREGGQEELVAAGR